MVPPPPTGHSHRPTQKQTNKGFKSRHSTKGSLKDAAKGRTHRPSPSTASHPKTTNASLSANHKKLNRRNHAKQMQEKKRALLEDSSKIFARREDGERVKRVVAVVGMTEDVDVEALVRAMLNSVGVEMTGEGFVRDGDILKFHSQSLRFLLLPPASDPTSLFPIIDGCGAADFVMIGLSSDQEVDERGETVLRTLTGLGVGSNGGVMGVVTSLPSHPTQASSTRASLHSFLNHFFPTIERISNLSIPSEATNAVRALCERVPKGIRWREGRGRLLADAVEWSPAGGEVEEEKVGEGSERRGTLKVVGTIRGARMSADRLVHLPGYGDFRVERITTAPPTNPARAARIAPSSMSVDQTFTPTDLSLPSEEADDLASTNVPDDSELLLGEQTWPTEEELASAPAARARAGEGEMLPPALPGTTPKRLKRVPRGTSAYQAAWILDEDDDDDEYSDEDEDEAMNGTVGEGEDEEEEEEDMVNLDETTADDDLASVSARPFADLSPEVEAAQLAAYLAERGRERALASRDDLDFPDEIDTPMEIAARERFARYRGLKSFRTSKWDPYEELPEDYSRCFMFEDFRRMGRKMETRATRDGVEAGTRVIMHISDVPESFVANRDPRHPLLLFSLHQHEHKYSVMHFTVQRNTEYSDPVRSKDPLVAVIGPRRFVVNPIFSAHTSRGNGKGANNVHKFERFLRHGINATIATVYLPVTFGAPPAVLLRVPSSSSRDVDTHLVGTGSLLSSDPTRITAKRIILTGHPFKVHKKTATIRYMFFNQPDIEYFKPIQLRTKKGRTGHIRESLGTHGYFKAGFDGLIDQMDTICLNLYKRCFPKWGRVWDGGLVGETKRREVEDRFGEQESGTGDIQME